jgi:hypothetical protein
MLPAPGKDEYIVTHLALLNRRLMQTETKKISYKKALLAYTGRAE